MLYSLFRHTKDTKDVEDPDKLRALIAHADEQTPQQVLQVRENMMSKTIYLESFVHQLRDATLLPSTRVIYQMTPSEINDKNQLIDDVLTNFEEQLKRDFKSFELELQQNVLITKLNYEQQLHIHALNLDSFNVANQRQEILDKALGLDIQVKVSQVKDTLKDLQNQLAQQWQTLTKALNPIDTNTVMETITRLRDALKDATFQNAYLVMKNNELTLDNSFMTPTQEDIIAKIKAEQSPRYMNQRTDPQCIVRKTKDSLPMYKRKDLPPQRCELLPSNEDLLKEVEEVLRTQGKKRENPSPTTLPLSATAGRGKRKDDHITPRPGDIKYPSTEEGSSSVENTDTPKQNPPQKGSRSTSSKGKGKYGSNMGWRYNAHREPSSVPALISSGPDVQFYWIEDLECPGTERCDLKTVDYKLPTSTRFMSQAIHTPPSDTWLKPRVEGEIVTPAIREIYLHALECMRQAIQSPYDRLIQDRYTGGWHDCEGRFAPPSAARDKIPYWYSLPYESNKLDDFIYQGPEKPAL
jgi:hypothetical protein